MTPLTAGAKAATTSRTAVGKTLTPRTISMSSVRPMQRTRGAVRPQAQRPAATRTWSRLRKRSSGAARWREVGIDELALGAVLERRARRRSRGR